MIRLLSSLRLRLLGLVLFVAIPALGLVLYQGYVQRRMAEASSLAEARRLTDGACDDIDVAVRDSRILLDLLARLPEARRGDDAACEALFRDLLSGRGRADDEAGTGPAIASARRAHSAPYGNIGLADLQGQVVASAVPLPAPVNVGDRLYFRRALATRAFAIGEYQMGRITKKPGLNVARPVFGPDGRPRAVVFAAIDLGWLSAAPAGDSLSPGAVFAVIDHHGTILARRPDPGRWVGRDLHDSPVIRAVLSHREGVIEAKGVDGVPRLWSFRPVEGTRDAAAYAMLGMDRKMVFAGADRVMRRSLLMLALTALVALFAAWLGARVFILRPVDAIVSAARRLRAGDMTARTSMTEPGELGDLGRSFDRMAVSLDDRQRELEGAAAAARENYETLQAVITASPVAIVVLDRERRTILWPPAAERLFGWKADEIVGQVQPPYIPPDDRQGSSELAGRALAGERLADIEVRRVRRDGKLLELSLSTAAIRGPDGTAEGIVAVYMDLTARRQLERQLHQAQKMEAIGRLAGGVAHDFNNLLTVILGFTEMRPEALRPGPGGAPRRSRRSTRPARAPPDLTRQLLAFSRRQPVQPRMRATSTPWSRTWPEMLRRLIGEHIELADPLARGSGAIRADPGQIEQVIAEPGGERARRHARGREARHRDRQPRPARTAPARAAARRARVRAWCCGERHRHRHGRRDPAATSSSRSSRPRTPARAPGSASRRSTASSSSAGGDIEVGTRPRARARPSASTCRCAAGPAEAEAAAPASHASPRRARRPCCWSRTRATVRGLVRRERCERRGYGCSSRPHGEEALEAGGAAPRSDRPAADRRGHARDERPRAGAPPERDPRPGCRVLYMSGYATSATEHATERRRGAGLPAEALRAGRARAQGARGHRRGDIGRGADGWARCYPPPAMRFAPFVLAALCVLVLFLGLDRVGVLDEREARDAQVARELIQRREVLTPLYGGQPLYEKPTPAYALEALAYWREPDLAGAFPPGPRGPRGAARPHHGRGGRAPLRPARRGLRGGRARHLGRCCRSRRAATARNCSARSSPGSAAKGLADVVFGRARGRDLRLVVTYGALAAALVCAGPLTALWPLGGLALYLALARDREDWRRARPLAGLAIMLGVALPVVRGDDRAPRRRLPRHAPFFPYAVGPPMPWFAGAVFAIPFLVLGCFPWSALLPDAMVHAATWWRGRLPLLRIGPTGPELLPAAGDRAREARRGRGAFLHRLPARGARARSSSIHRRPLTAALPAAPAAALLCGRLMDHLFEDPKRLAQALTRSALTLAVAGSVAAVTFVVLATRVRDAAPGLRLLGAALLLASWAPFLADLMRRRRLAALLMALPVAVGMPIVSLQVLPAMEDWLNTRGRRAGAGGGGAAPRAARAGGRAAAVAALLRAAQPGGGAPEPAALRDYRAADGMTYLAFRPSREHEVARGVQTPLEILTRTPTLIVARVRLD